MLPTLENCSPKNLGTKLNAVYFEVETRFEQNWASSGLGGHRICRGCWISDAVGCTGGADDSGTKPARRVGISLAASAQRARKAARREFRSHPMPGHLMARSFILYHLSFQFISV